MEPALENLCHQCSAIGSLRGAFLAPPLEPFSRVLSGKWYRADFEMDMVLVIYRHFEDQQICPLDLGVNDLAVQVVDIRHSEISGNRLAIGIFYKTPDAPLALLDGYHGIAFDNLVARRLPVPAVHETHMGVIQRVVDVVEVIADAIQAHRIEAHLPAFKFWISWQWRRLTFAKIDKD